MNPVARLLGWLLPAYALFILYGTFIPFSFSADPADVAKQFDLLLTWPFENGERTFSLVDAVSNVFLFVPFGFLLAVRWLSSARAYGEAALILRCAVAGTLYSMAIETGQLFAPGRTPSFVDIVTNGSGAVIGGFIATRSFEALGSSLGRSLRRVVTAQPALLLSALILLMYVADAWFPYMVTLDVSSVLSSIRDVRWTPEAWPLRYLIELAIGKVLPLVAAAYLLARSLQALGVRRTALPAWAALTVMVVLVEAAKIFFIGRSPALMNLLVASGGAAAGVTIARLVDLRAVYGRDMYLWAALMMLIVIAWLNLSPFVWVDSLSQLHEQLSYVEWLPMASYYGADPRAAVFDLGTKIYVVGLLGFAISASSEWRARPGLAMFVAMAAGVVIELVQLGLPDRVTSLTDVLVFAAGGWLGGHMDLIYRAWRRRVAGDATARLSVNFSDTDSRPGMTAAAARLFPDQKK